MSVTISLRFPGQNLSKIVTATGRCRKAVVVRAGLDRLRDVLGDGRGVDAAQIRARRLEGLVARRPDVPVQIAGRRRHRVRRRDGREDVAGLVTRPKSDVVAQVTAVERRGAAALEELGLHADADAER